MTTQKTGNPVRGGATVLVAVKSVPVGGRHLRVMGDALTREGISHGLDPVNETAVEWALQLREHGDAKRIVAATMGAADSEDALRRALAMGCDEALRVTGDGLAGGDRQGHQQLDSAGAALLGPQPHPNRRHEKKIEPRMPCEERHERRFAPLEEVAYRERKKTGEQEEDHEKHVCDRRSEVAAEFALHDRLDVSPY